MLHDAFHDALTGLPNRALFMDHAKMAIQRSRRDENRIFAALFLDLDRFKVINDSLGHMVGDQLLVGIARRLETCLRPGDTVARLGGDEFTILLEDLLETEDAIEIAERVQEIVTQPFNIGGQRSAPRPASASPRAPSAMTTPTTSCATPTPPCTAPSSSARSVT